MEPKILKPLLHAIVIILAINSACFRGSDTENKFFSEDSLFVKGIPEQPGEDSWKFVEDLKSPLWTKHDWIKLKPGETYADLSEGISLTAGFPDEKNRLNTAYEDLKSFLAAGGVKSEDGKYIIETVKDAELTGESFSTSVSKEKCIITAGDVDGIRRAVFHLEDEMLRLRAANLPLGQSEKHPVILKRISRCFFGPIKRYPKMRDELMDDVDYYPGQYLNRLAHEGVNGLWLTVEFRDLVATTFTPDAGKDGERRLAKLRQTVEKCLDYGIKTYIFCIEPRAWEKDDPVIKKYPELAGAPAGSGNFFCPMSKTAYDYLYETVNKIFKAVPELGGMINITHGERGTTCLSSLSCTSEYEGHINCPRCTKHQPWEILYASLSAMEEGMHDAAPEAELISWLYMPQPQRFLTGDPYSLGEWVYDLPAHTPERVVLQFNFESGVSRTEFGKFLVGGDYWISKPGPSDRFERIANIARENGTKVSAKIQTGNSHEVATVPFVPVPSLLYRKFRAMKELGVTHTMLCWYFGNYPGLMNKAAGLLPMEPFPENEDQFLQSLASVDWKKDDVPEVIEAWKLFSEGYENYPLVNLFQYYGPVHDGPVWPLLVKPADVPLAPTWQIASSATRKLWPPSGDRVGECIGDVLTLEEVTELCRKMSESWDKGTAILQGLKNKYSNEPVRLLDIGVAEALGLQFRSGYNILRFYVLREKMFRMEGRERFDLLSQMEKIIRAEIILDKQLLALSEKDSRLGFHSEAEGYKYFPEKIRWRMEQLKSLLKNDIPEMQRMIREDQLLFPEYTGKKPEGAAYTCKAFEDRGWLENSFEMPVNLEWQSFPYGSDTSGISWASCSGRDALYFFVSADYKSRNNEVPSPFSGVEIRIEPERLYPAGHFEFSPPDKTGSGDPVHIIGYPLLYRGNFREYSSEGKNYIAMRIPFENIKLDRENLHPLRMDIIVRHKQGGVWSWRPSNPLTSRLILGSDNPADPGWLIFLK